MAAAQALHEIIDSDVVAADITAIEVSVPPPFLKMVDHGIVGGRIARLTSQPYQMAIAAVARDLAYDVGQMGDVPADVLQLMNKITVRPNEDLLDGFPRQWAASLHVRTTNSEHRRLIRNIPGDPERPFDESAIKTKAFRLIGSTADNLVVSAGPCSKGGRRPSNSSTSSIARAQPRAATRAEIHEGGISLRLRLRVRAEGNRLSLSM